MESCPQRRNPLLCVRISADNERMRSLCCSVIAGLGIALSACNNPMLLVDVEIDFLPMGTTQLLVVTTVNGQPGREQHLSPDQRRIAIHLPQGASGTVGVRVYGMDAGECILTEGSLEAAVPTSFNRTEQHSIQMARPSKAKCSFAPLETGVAGPQPTLFSIWGSDPENIYMVAGITGIDSVIRCASGSHVCSSLDTPRSSATNYNYSDVWGSDKDSVFVVNNASIIARCNSNANSCSALTFPTPPSQQFASIWGSDPENIYVVGGSSRILRCSSTANNCIALTSPGGPLLKTVWGSSAEYVYSVGQSGTPPSDFSIVRCRARSTDCSKLSFLAGQNLSAIWGSDDENVYVAGTNGTIARCTAASDECNRLNSGTTAKMNKIWGSDPANVYVVGVNSILRCRSGSDTCSALNHGTAGTLNGVWGSDSRNVYVVGDSGVIVRCSIDSDTCTRLTSTVTNNLKAVFGTDSNNIYVVGEGGTILRRRL